MSDSTPPLTDAVDVRVVIGQQPSYWNRNVAFIANLLGMFFGNAEETRMLEDTVGEVDSYGGRLLPILNLIFAGDGNNLLALERAPDDYLAEFFAETAGLSLPDVAILPHRDYVRIGHGEVPENEDVAQLLADVADLPVSHLDGYVTDGTLSGLADALGKRTCSTIAGSRYGNNKYLLHCFLESTGLPVPPTEIAEKPADVGGCLESLKMAGFESGVIKAPMGASGIGLIKMESLDDCQDAGFEVPDHFFTEGPCLIQGWLAPGSDGITGIRSPSVQLFLDDVSVSLYDLTEQILSGDSVHEGNESPPPYLGDLPGCRDELLRQAGMAAQWLHQQGYRGTASVDFLVAEHEGGRSTVYVCEINARVTGATYPSVLARHFMPDGCWLLRNLRFDESVSGKEILDLLSDSEDLFVPNQSEYGVFPVNFNFDSNGLINKGQFLCLAPSSLGNKRLLRMAELDLPCRFDRD